MNVLFVVAHPTAGDAFVGLSGACGRAGVAYRCFFTGDGVRVLEQAHAVNAARNAQRAVVCEHSWARHFPAAVPPVEQGSQTDHSAMIGEAMKVVSL